MVTNPKLERKRPGAALVETAVAMIVCLIFLFAIFEYGRFVMMKQLLENATREGARQAVVTTNTLTDTDIQNTVTAFLAGQPLTIASFSVYKADPTNGNPAGPWNSAAFGQSIAVDVTGTYKPILPTFGMLPNPVTLKAKATMNSEAN
jgi:Flp pilus assembly protein TadG